MYIYEPYQVITYVLVGIGTFILAFALTNLFVIKKEKDAVASNAQAKKTNGKVYSPIEGEIIPISEVDDQVFASKMMGEGFAVLPSDGTIKAPISGIVKMIAPTKHAIGIVADDGMELLLHLGIDTVDLNGEPFTLTIKEGETLQQGQVIGTIDLNQIEVKGKDATVMVIITDSKEAISGLEYNQDYVLPILGS